MLKVRKAGLYTTVQDLGRFGYRAMGVPVSGVMDDYSSSIANSLLENDEKAAVLEITMTGPTLEFIHPSFVALSGADISPSLNGSPIEINKVHKVQAGDVLSFGKLLYGYRAYLAVKGGFLTDMRMNSRSFYKPVTARQVLRDHAEVAYDASQEFEPKISEVSPESFHREKKLEVFQGPEYKILNDKQLEALFAGEFHIAKENNRMAYQLQETIPAHQHSMLTSATLPGTVQLTPAGKLIVLMKDGQTTGGYPRILQLSQTAVSLLAQKKFADPVQFQMK